LAFGSQLVATIVLVGGLILVHEFGHFMWAKIFGVKVLRFSMGFGPKLFGFRRGETEYVLAAIPLGGFVKMLGEDHGEPLSPEDEKRAFHKQPLWKRFVIVFAGPAMNLVFPVVAFFFVFLGHTELRAASVGVVLPGRPAARAGLAPGDRIVSVDGVATPSFPEVQDVIKASAGKRLALGVERHGRRLQRPLYAVPRRAVVPMAFGVKQTHGRLDFVAAHPMPIVSVEADSPAAAAGMRTFDLVTHLDGEVVARRVDLERRLGTARGDPLRIDFLRPERVDAGFAEIAVFRPGLARVIPDGSAEGARTGLGNAEMIAWHVPDGSPEWRAGLRPGDEILSLDGRRLGLWTYELRDHLSKNGDRERTLGYRRAGAAVTLRFRMETRDDPDELGQTGRRYLFRTRNLAIDAPDELVPNEHLLAYAARQSIRKTGEVLEFLSVMIVRLFQGRVSFRTVGGPLTLYDVAGRAAEGGASDFLFTMALVSLNLALVNLLPIPVLDGGHLFFFLCEAVLRRPVSLRTREVASMVGLSLILLLMIFVFKNDFERFGPAIVSFFERLVS